jgi:DNA-binding winged helix-turn-helix (wHTH) protein
MARELRFGDFVLNEGTRQLDRGGEKVSLSPKAFETLQLLLNRYPDAVPRKELLDVVWGEGVFVTDGNLSTAITEIRTALGDDARSPSFVRTVHAFGYQFLKAVTSPEVLLCRVHWLSGEHTDRKGRHSWDGGQVALREGEHVLGSDRNVDVWLPAHGVSRRHARLHVTTDQTSILDLGSKNGTCVGGQRIQVETALRDGDEVRLGRLTITIHLAGRSDSSTATV